MNRQDCAARVALALIAVLAAPVSIAAPVNAPKSCAVAIKDAMPLVLDKWRIIIPPRLGPHAYSKGEFETSADYAKRVRTKSKESLDRTARLVDDLVGKRHVKFVYEFAYSDVSYDADRQLVKLSKTSNPVFSKKLPTVDGERPFNVVVRREGKEQVMPGKFDSKTVQYDSAGIAFRNGLKTPYMKAGALSGMTFPLDAGRGKEVLKRLGIVFVGEMSQPYRAWTFSSHDDLASLTITKSSTEFWIVELKCAAIIDKATEAVISELH